MPDKPLRIFLTGAHGQVGWELNRALLSYGVLYASGKDTLDLLDEGVMRSAVREFRPDVIINSAAYTAVDKAETERGLCYTLNVHAPKILAQEAEELGAWMVHYSTDYVFNGQNDRPWREDDEPDPINFYGQTKLEGDKAVIANSSKHLIFRTSWVYASRGSNFLLTILRLFSAGKDIRVVNDQMGAPTWARYIAQSTIMALSIALESATSLSGVYNLVNSGVTSWHGFAFAIRECAGGSQRFGEAKLTPVSSSEYPTPAARPRWSVLATDKTEKTFNVHPVMWDEAMRLCVKEIGITI